MRLISDIVFPKRWYNELIYRAETDLKALENKKTTNSSGWTKNSLFNNLTWKIIKENPDWGGIWRILFTDTSRIQSKGKKKSQQRTAILFRIVWRVWEMAWVQRLRARSLLASHDKMDLLPHRPFPPYYSW